MSAFFYLSWYHLGMTTATTLAHPNIALAM
jgi:hypothetical protein